MKKQLLSALAAMVLTSTVWAMPEGVVDKTEAMEAAVYGKVQAGALVDRVNQLDMTVYGTRKSGDLTKKVDALYTDVEGRATKASVVQELNFLEWMYQDEVSEGHVLERFSKLERSVNGTEETGSIYSRINKLKQSIFGHQRKLVLKEGVLTSADVFKVRLLKPISTKKNSKGEPVLFSVAEDIMDGDVLLVPKGMTGMGYISELKKASSFGRNSKLDIVFEEVPAIDGSTFVAVQGPEAKEKMKSEFKAAGASVAGAALLGPIGLVGGFFVKGKSIELPEGTLVYVQPEANTTVQGVVVTEGPMVNGPITPAATTVTSTPTVAVDSVANDKVESAKVVVNEETPVVSTPVVEEVIPVETEVVDTSKEEIKAVPEAEGEEAFVPNKPIVIIKRSE